MMVLLSIAAWFLIVSTVLFLFAVCVALMGAV